MVLVLPLGPATCPKFGYIIPNKCSLVKYVIRPILQPEPLMVQWRSSPCLQAPPFPCTRPAVRHLLDLPKSPLGVDRVKPTVSQTGTPAEPIDHVTHTVSTAMEGGTYTWGGTVVIDGAHGKMLVLAAY